MAKKPNINRWVGKRGAPQPMQSKDDDPINVLSDLMGDDYALWYQTLPLSVAGNMTKFRAVVEQKIEDLSYPDNDNGVGPYHINSDSPASSDGIEHIF